ncbi:MAG: hypothetical protein D6812_14570, partial [Deltaproteobacteria bacterium]
MFEEDLPEVCGCFRNLGVLGKVLLHDPIERPLAVLEVGVALRLDPFFEPAPLPFFTPGLLRGALPLPLEVTEGFVLTVVLAENPEEVPHHEGNECLFVQLVFVDTPGKISSEGKGESGSGPPEPLGFDLGLDLFLIGAHPHLEAVPLLLEKAAKNPPVLPD